MAPKEKKCKICKEKYQPSNTLQQVCSPKCAIEHAQRAEKKRYKQETKELKEKIKSRSDWLRECQIAFNRYIRARDRGKPCISCGKLSGAKMNAGHYLTVGAHPALRFEEENCTAQCEWCNSYLSGNQVRYRQGLIERIGLERVEWLEGPHEPKKYTIDELKEIKAKYNKLARELEKE